jgi:hypothetical protein
LARHIASSFVTPSQADAVNCRSYSALSSTVIGGNSSRLIITTSSGWERRPEPVDRYAALVKAWNAASDEDRQRLLIAAEWEYPDKNDRSSLAGSPTSVRA